MRLLVVGILCVAGKFGGHCKADKDRKTNTQLDIQVPQMLYRETEVARDRQKKIEMLALKSAFEFIK